MAIIEKDSERFDRALSLINQHGGAVRLLSWPDKSESRVPECGAAYGDITTTLRTFVQETNSRISLALLPKGRASEEFKATWVRAERDEPHEGEPPLHEDAMDSLFFEDNTSYHFDEWSAGRPFVLVDINAEPSMGWFKPLFQWCADNIAQIVVAVAAAAIISWLGFNVS